MIRGVWLAIAAAIASAACGAREPASPAHASAARRPSTRAAAADPEATTRFAARLSAAYGARDAAAAAALYAGGAVSERIGEPEERAAGRAAIQRNLSRAFSRYSEIQLIVGRVWVGRDASVIEHVFAGTRRPGTRGLIEERRVGVIGALVVTFDRDGLVAAERVYRDEITLIGQVEPRLVPDGMVVREVASGVPEGTAVAVSRGGAGEQANREVNARIWAALSAHRVDDALAPMADDYVYVDFAAPAPLDRFATRAMVARFLDLVPDLVFAEPPVVIAAGDDVVTEVVERGTRGGAAITLHAVDVRRFADGEVVREWQYSNYREVLAQLAGRDGREP